MQVRTNTYLAEKTIEENHRENAAQGCISLVDRLQDKQRFWHWI